MRSTAAPGGRSISDPVLDGLERQIDISNQNLKAAEAAFRQAAGDRRGGPRAASSRPSTGDGRGVALGQWRRATGTRRERRRHRRFTASTRRRAGSPICGAGSAALVESDVASAQASAGRSRLRAALGAGGARHRLFRAARRRRAEAPARRRRSELRAGRSQITRNQYSAGVAAASDVARRRPSSQGTQAQAIDVGVQRAQLEHAIAVLIGKPPAEFSIAAAAPLTTAHAVDPARPAVDAARAPSRHRRGRAAAWRRRMPRSASPRRRSIRTSRCRPRSAIRASLSAASFSAASRSGRSGRSSPRRCSTAACAAPRSRQTRAAYDQNVANYRQTVLAGVPAGRGPAGGAAHPRRAGGGAGSGGRSRRARPSASSLNQYLAGTVAYTSGRRRRHRAQRPGGGAQHPAEPAHRQRRADPGAGRRLGQLATAERCTGQGGRRRCREGRRRDDRQHTLSFVRTLSLAR